MNQRTLFLHSYYSIFLTVNCLILEDNVDDQEIVTEILKDLKVQNELIFFEKSSDAFSFLRFTKKQPFVILCDRNIPILNGLDFKKQIDDDPELRQKSGPFIFFSTAATNCSIRGIYKNDRLMLLSKNSNVQELKHQLFIILEYEDCANTIMHNYSYG